jgi:hypothetical protein
MARQIVDPFKGSKDLGIASKIIFSRSNTEKMAALLISHGAPDALRKKRKLVFRWLFGCSSIVVRSSDFRTSFFCFRPRVSARPPIFIFAPLSSQPRGLFRRNITLSAPTFRALKNIMDKTGFLDLLARGSHFNIASDAERIVFRWLDHARLHEVADRDSRFDHSRNSSETMRAKKYDSYDLNVSKARTERLSDRCCV